MCVWRSGDGSGGGDGDDDTGLSDGIHHHWNYETKWKILKKNGISFRIS